MRLNKDSVRDVLMLLSNYNLFVTETIISEYCNDAEPVRPSVHIYGHYVDNQLVSVMTATFMLVMPHADSPSGRIIHISGAYTHPDFRYRSIASRLLREIEDDARMYFHADYLCCDSSADGLYISNGFEKSEETRLWKKLL